jgi:ribosomal protein S18 acetylase RimI-like enzyme
VARYRKFTNTDPPQLVQAWNEIFTGHGAVPLQSATLLDRFVLAKPYFDPAGLVIAEDDGVCLGFAHAGLIADSQPLHGVTCLLGVRPGLRKQGIGSELLARAEQYLRQRGAQLLSAGEQGRCSPFYLGLYGGSEGAGFLSSDVNAEPFLTRRGYKVDRRILVLQRDLLKPLKVADPRFALLRQHFEMRVRSPHNLGFNQECSLGSVEPLEFFLLDKRSQTVAASTLAWEMEGFSCRWHHPAAGLVGFHVQPELRRQGLGKFLLVTLLRQLQEQYCEIVETHIDENHKVAVKFLGDLGFQQVDVGQVFVKPLAV